MPLRGRRDPGLSRGDAFGYLPVPAIGIDEEREPPRPIGECGILHDVAGMQRHPGESCKCQVPLLRHRRSEVPVEERNALAIAPSSIVRSEQRRCDRCSDRVPSGYPSRQYRIRWRLEARHRRVKTPQPGSDLGQRVVRVNPRGPWARLPTVSPGRKDKISRPDSSRPSAGGPIEPRVV